MSFMMKTENGYIPISGNNGSSASEISYDNTESSLEAENVQEAIDEIVDTKANKTEILPAFTLSEYEEIKDSIPVGTKFIITDDEGGDDPTPTPTPSGVNAVNSYAFINDRDSYTFSVKNKYVKLDNNYKSIVFTHTRTTSSYHFFGTGYIVLVEGKIFAFENGSASKTELTNNFAIIYDETKEELTLTFFKARTNGEFIINI